MQFVLRFFPDGRSSTSDNGPLTWKAICSLTGVSLSHSAVLRGAAVYRSLTCHSFHLHTHLHTHVHTHQGQVYTRTKQENILTELKCKCSYVSLGSEIRVPYRWGGAIKGTISSTFKDTSLSSCYAPYVSFKVTLHLNDHVIKHAIDVALMEPQQCLGRDQFITLFSKSVRAH